MNEAEMQSQNCAFSMCNDEFYPMWPPWQKEGISPCFYDAVSSTVLFVISAVLFFQVYTYNKRYRSHVRLERPRIRAFFTFKGVLLLLLLCEPLARCGIVWNLGNRVFGMELLSAGCTVVAASGCILLLWFERLTREANRGHCKVLLIFFGILLCKELLCVVSWNSSLWWFANSTPVHQANFGFWIARLTISLCLFLSGILAQRWYRRKPSERTNLYGSGTSSTWKDFFRKMKILLPFLWPTKDKVLQFNLFVGICLVAVGRVVNVYVPIYYKSLVQWLQNQQSYYNFVKQAAVYVGMKCLQGSGAPGGVLSALQVILSVRVELYTTKTMQEKLFNHLHRLPMKWHLKRKSGEVMESIRHGVLGISKMLINFLFDVVPSICDLFIAVVYFVREFNAWFGLFMFGWITMFLVCTIAVIEWKTKFQRGANQKRNYSTHVAYDSLMNFETVKSYNAESFEAKKFSDAIVDYQKHQFWVELSLKLSNLTQMGVIHVGLFCGTLLCGKYVLNGSLQVADFILFETYITQLYKPLGAFGLHYMTLQSNFVDMENILDLFNEESEVADKIDDVTISKSPQSVEFDDVCYSYDDDQPVLKNVSFSIKSGQKCVMVGASGSGKTTIIRLLQKFFVPDTGTIKLNGVDISNATKCSVRNCIGIVSQNCTLFCDSIMKNIIYVNEATADQVREATCLTDIHDYIVDKPEGYETNVGETGVKVNCGERERLALARLALKDPGIIVLDKPSFLETMTMSEIRKTVYGICRNKTSLIVTNRLAIAADADCVLVVKDGQIIEQGTHSGLLLLGGVYADMWKQQVGTDAGGNSNLLAPLNWSPINFM